MYISPNHYDHPQSHRACLAMGLRLVGLSARQSLGAKMNNRQFTRMHNDYLDPDLAGINDVHPSNEWIAEAFPNANGPAELYHQTYKYTSCGPGIGVTVAFEEEPTDLDAGPNSQCFPKEIVRTFYCDSLRQFGTWKEMDKRGQLVIGFTVSSIVEGVDQCTDTVTLDLDTENGDVKINGYEFQHKDAQDSSSNLTYAWDEAIRRVEEEANQIWNGTHGCEGCAKHWHRVGVRHDDWGNEFSKEGCDGCTPIYTKCRSCKGHGAII